MTPAQQNDRSRLIVKIAIKLLGYGADSSLVEELAQRFGLALKLQSIELSISANAVVLTSLYDGRCVTTTRRMREHGINMGVVYQLQRLCIACERGRISVAELTDEVESLQAKSYPIYVVIPMVALACASFCQLFGGDMAAFGLTFLVTACSMLLRQRMAAHHFNPLITWAVTAFVATLLASLPVISSLSSTPELVQASSVLMLIPGFPLMNAISDMLQGHINVGIARWVFASLLTLSCAIGITLALSIG